VHNLRDYRQGAHTVRAPTPGTRSSSAKSAGPQRAGSLDVRGMAGRNCVVAGIEGFVDAQAGYRFYNAALL
jgi:hypothetical protein